MKTETELEFLSIEIIAFIDEITKWIEYMEKLQCMDLQQVIQIDSANLRRFDILKEFIENFGLKIQELDNKAKAEFFREKKFEFDQLFKSLQQQHTQAKIKELQHIQNEAMKERKRLIDGDESALVRRRAKLDPVNLKEETTKTLKRIQDMMDISVQATKEAQNTFHGSSATVRSTMIRSSQFQFAVGKARQAMEEWWKMIGSEDRWYYGSLLFFSFVVILIVIRRVPIALYSKKDL
ncbi:uncharacterized protein MONOS_10403 [Monocercomonoides exilis]|uniref:uncharacterized protein n=1 Tax=Monocercomonoides exilis TaxID=2049356 RepID=UPI003559D0F2|nr:hypothetical protein MONOS_10403 [Monocercomonoides exilis]|eukprot:MONOS_10403.1-p1 / transcript=MONOS_10403.1 / gene=MONOS_10403 / organism=Monocercomonoides_exilis_PA203 / gene_product=unspecified product / transcript_product=unspecified product / location=Mono_scaffold00472:44606-45417(+) / protein_length=237 / sequence_SO=supercontig / SO=protein_coding / is_pseudo=false